MKPSLLQTLASHQKWGWALLFLLLLGWWIFYPANSSKEGKYSSEIVKRGDLSVTISASGTLQPLKSIAVGSELSGTLDKVLVDENDTVKKGQLLATLEPSKLTDAITRSRAAVASAQAQVLQAKATLQESTANLRRQQQVYELSGGKVPSAVEMEAATATLERAKAALAVSQASVQQAQANLKSDETNLQKAVIRSPINGVVLSRAVEAGQTVAASMSTPTLFTISEDLRQMELKVNVDEADVSAVKEGQAVRFNVAAYPGVDFPASITRVGIGSTITDNVVTYKTVLTVNNTDLRLRPGMTATAKIITANRQGVLLVPNSALRFTPPEENINNAPGKSSFVSQFIPRPPSSRGVKKAGESINAGSQQKLWVLQNGTPTLKMVSVGVSNGKFTEITGGELEEGMSVITSYQTVK
jgi:HlyD family secretion protein